RREFWNLRADSRNYTDETPAFPPPSCLEDPAVFHIPGSGYRLCDGISRRDFLRIGSLGAAGLGLPGLLQSRARAAAPGGKATSCLLLYRPAGPPQMDTFDLKPDAPPEIRGELKPIATNVPGVNISESLPLLSRHADKYSIVRSVSFNMSVG